MKLVVYQNKNRCWETDPTKTYRTFVNSGEGNMAGYTHTGQYAEETWQTEKKNVTERSRFMFNNELMSDVHFRVGKSEKLRIPAHKFVMAISSPVFYAMFYGRMAEKENEIKIGDCEAGSFLELLRYIYYDEAKIDPTNVFGILYLAKKYILPFLAEKCVHFLEENIDFQNAFTLLAQARYFCEPKLEEKCWEIIDRERRECCLPIPSRKSIMKPYLQY